MRGLEITSSIVIALGVRVKFCGMSEKQNYLRLRDDASMREIFEKRARIVQGIRQFFIERQFLEVETPMLVKLPGMEPYLDVFKTRFEPEHGEGKDMYLITSPEYAMKKLLVGGLPRIFQITRSFRNKETGGSLHNPEFTMIEWYRAEADYMHIMRDTEELVKFLCLRLYNKGSFVYRGKEIDVLGGFERVRVREAFERYAGVSREMFEDPELLVVEACKRGYQAKTYDDAFFLIFLNEIEAKLGAERPVILYEYPVSMAALSRVCSHDSRYAERFEVYVAGLELANAFSELADADEQRARLVAEREERMVLGKEVYDVDESFIEALRAGMPPSGGIALGVDRLVMLLLDEASIEDVVFFPFRDL